MKHKFEFAELIARMIDDCRLTPVMVDGVQVEEINCFKSLSLDKKLW